MYKTAVPKEKPKTFRRITLDMVLNSTSLTKSSKESSESYLGRVTHLHLQGKKIRYIEGLELCTNLKVLYLYDNCIETIQNLNFASTLQYLYISNNFIKDVPKLPMPVLRKIFLDDNEIKVLNGLQECERLEELRIARQRLPSFVSLHFDLGSLQGIARSLETIDISGNFISDLSPFSMLYNLRKFICKDNNVNDLIEVEKVVVLPYIAEVDLTGNPCATFFKYRDIVIAAASDSLRILDEIPIQDHQQVAIKGLMEHRKAIGAMARFNGSYNSSQEHEFDFGEN